MKWFVLLLLGCAAGTCIAADADARRLIAEASALLREGRDTLADSDERRRIDRALDVLQTPHVARRIPLDDMAASPSDRRPPVVNLVDFIDNTPQYRGKTITLNLTVRSLVFAGKGESLRDLRGSSARFLGVADDGNRLDLRVNLGGDLDVPKASFADRLLVTFRCSEGDLVRGNQAIAIRRPEPPLTIAGP